jgi:hypothetical protein
MRSLCCLLLLSGCAHRAALRSHAPEHATDAELIHALATGQPLWSTLSGSRSATPSHGRVQYAQRSAAAPHL